MDRKDNRVRIESVWYDERNDCNVIRVSGMPKAVNESTALVSGGEYDTFVMLINADKPQITQMRAYFHGVGHILDDDLYSGDDVQHVECRAHRKGQ